MSKRFRLISEEEEEEDNMSSTMSLDSFNIANVLMLLSKSHRAAAGDTFTAFTVAGGEATEEKVFECKTCSRKFTTFQALGGHRASHKKPRVGGGAATSAAVPEKPRAHECSICGLEFAIGQALGGHMRRHRAVGQSGGREMEKGSPEIDLNQPPLERGEEEEEEVRRLPKLLGFTLTPAMVDCYPLIY
ncbi:zinc finger protein ZAT12-like [Phalaenopsis equestris]|uniref:zinc finger protein ZAT12-like n=1 Tax=Phalaenopsis equestris TaxID=78828 RepID=UPI0009E22EEE|nr:zinc finger protein ZAT12-like [Phalaenopsis equestris]